MDALVQPVLAQAPQAGWTEAAARAVLAALVPEDDARIPAQYRQELAQTLVQQALERALERAIAKRDGGSA